MNHKIITMLMIIFIFSSSLMSRESNWQITLANDAVLTDISLIKLGDDSLYIADAQHTNSIAVASISRVARIKKSKFLLGSVIGLLVGAGSGALIGDMTYQKPSGMDIYGLEGRTIWGAVIGGLSGFLFGGIFGHASGVDEVYDLLEMDHAQKMLTLEQLLENQKR